MIYLCLHNERIDMDKHISEIFERVKTIEDKVDKTNYSQKIMDARD